MFATWWQFYDNFGLEGEGGFPGRLFGIPVTSDASSSQVGGVNSIDQTLWVSPLFAKQPRTISLKLQEGNRYKKFC